MMSPPRGPRIPETYTLGMMSTVISEFWIFYWGGLFLGPQAEMFKAQQDLGVCVGVHFQETK